jgi:hypothetical protein
MKKVKEEKVKEEKVKLTKSPTRTTRATRITTILMT